MTTVTQPVRNYRCLDIDDNNDLNDEQIEIILNNCPRALKNIELQWVLGEGSFGTVYKGKAFINNQKTKKKIDIAIKKITIKDPTDQDISELFDEVEYSYYMGEEGIAPIIYDSFFVKVGQTSKEETHKDIVQFIIMESMDTTVHDLLVENKVSIKKKNESIRKILHILYKQIYELGIRCTDIKPANFLYNWKNASVKVIDFGADSCVFSNKNYSKKELDALYLSLMILLYFNIRDYIKKLKLKTFKPFFENNIFKNRDLIFPDLMELLENDKYVRNSFEYYIVKKPDKYSKNEFKKTKTIQQILDKIYFIINKDESNFFKPQ
jgi:serine/threonine protein kinase